MKQVKLNNLSRLLLIPILQKAEGNILAVRQVRDLIPKIGFSEEELKPVKEGGLGIEAVEKGGVKWGSDKEIEISLGNTVYELLKKQLEDMSKKGKVNLQWLDLCERVLKKEDLDLMLKELEEKEEKEEKEGDKK